MTAPIASGWSGCRWGLHPLESAALSRRTPEPDIHDAKIFSFDQAQQGFKASAIPKRFWNELFS
jgi:hypothetical protein